MSFSKSPVTYSLNIALLFSITTHNSQVLSGEARDLTCKRPHAHTQKCDKLHAQMKLLVTCFPYITACGSSRYTALLYTLKTTFLLISILQIVIVINNGLKKMFGLGCWNQNIKIASLILSRFAWLILDLSSEATTRGVLEKSWFQKYCNIHCYCNIQFTYKQTVVFDY